MFPKSWTRAALTGVVLAVPVAAQSPASQAPPPMFRSSVTLVTVDVTVLDHDGRPVPGLTERDFQVKLNGKTQPVRALSYVQVATRSANLVVTDIPPETTGRHVVTNNTPPESRLFVLFVDDLSIPPGGAKSFFEAAARWVGRLPAEDAVGLASTTGTVVVNPTRERAPVMAAVRRLTGEFADPRRPLVPNGPTVSIAEALDIVDYNDMGTLRSVIARECFGGNANEVASGAIEFLVARNQCAGQAQGAARMIAAQTRAATRRQVDAVMATVIAMKPAKGLKQLVLMSQGIGVTRNSYGTFEPVARVAADAGVQVSVLMEGGDEVDMADGGRSPENVRGDASGSPDAGLTARRREDRRMFQSSARTLADATGGFYQTIIGAADQAFDRAQVAGSAVYRLGVEPPGDAPEGAAFSVSASVKKTGVTIHTNRQAVLPGPPPVVTAEQQMTEAINEGQAHYNVPIRLAVSRRRAASGQIELAIGADVPGKVPGPVTVQFGLVDKAGQLRTGKRPLEAAPGASYRLTFPLPVAPGPYSLRFAVTDATGSVGSLSTSVDAALVPLGPLDVSDVLTWWMDARGKAQFLVLDEIPAGVAALGAGLEVYPKPGATFPEHVVVTMALVPVGTSTPVIRKDVTPLSGGDLLRAEASLPLAGVPAGRYVLSATVTVDGSEVGTVTAPITRR